MNTSNHPTGLDSNGFILSEVSQENILPQYRSVIDASIAALKTTLPDVVHSVYVYGSVARGNAIPGKSDLDMLVIFKRKLTQQEQDALKGLQESLSSQHKTLVREVGIADATCTYDEMLDSTNKYGWGAYLKILCVCVDGEDLTERFEQFKISPDIAIGFNGDASKAIQSAIEKITNAKTDDDAAKAAAIVARKLIRTCYMMVMTRAQVWTTRLSEQAELFLRYFPEKQGFIRTLQSWIDTPSTDREAILKVLRGDCRWVIDNFEAEAKVTGD
ncbi:MAG TPA: nucleotidyltransferase domain-containing protein [Candidatus Saccharimonadales bacterium]|nr:nucleotidyltransferase domain-containing protein [Candidatus Saccharimonadales bacterium]